MNNLDASISTERLWGARTSVANITDLDVSDSAHPNMAPFTGTLLLLDEPSTQPPHGSDGHLILVPTRVAKERLSTLPGMAINYQNDLTGHNPAKKVGIISEAWIDGNEVKVKGLIWKKDFPEALATFRANKGKLGMSMELGDVYVREKNEEVWHLEDFHFTGATVLRKDHAAYEATDLAASRQQHFVRAIAAAKSAKQVSQENGGQPAMATKEKDKKDKASKSNALVVAISAAVASGLKNGMADLLAAQEKSSKTQLKVLSDISASQEELVKAVAASDIEAEVEEDDDSEVEIEAEADASMVESGADSSEDDSSEEDDADASEVEAEVDPTNYNASEQTDDAEPGDLNKTASEHYKEQSKGPATSRISKAGGKTISRGTLAAARERRQKVANMDAAREVIALKAEISRMKKDFAKITTREKNKVEALQASVGRYAEQVERRSVAPELSALLEKNGYNVSELFASKQKLTVAQVDEMFQKSGVAIDPTMRAAMKNQFSQLGLMDDGRVIRYQ